MEGSYKVGEVPVKIELKKIKHMHLYVRPPHGDVLVTAPLECEPEVAVAYVRQNFAWVLKKRAGMKAQRRQTPRQFVSGETHYIWGRQFFLKVEKQKGWGGVELQGNKLIMKAPAGSTAKSREMYMSEWYRNQLREVVDAELPKWEARTGFKISSYSIKNMTRRWGSCSPKRGTVTFNLQLARKPKEGLAYVILHELCHFGYPDHGEGFVALLGRYMPDWRKVRQRLNDAPLDFIVED